MEHQLSILFRELNIEHRGVVQEYLDQLGLYVGQPRFLFQLYRNPGMTQRDLSLALKLSKETVSVTVRRLEQAGYLERVSDPNDKRSRLLYLSEQGEVLMPELTENFNAINERMFSKLDPYEIKTLESLYKKMIQGLERSDDQ